MGNVRIFGGLGTLLVLTVFTSICVPRAAGTHAQASTKATDDDNILVARETGNWRLVLLGQLPTVGTMDDNPRIDFASRDFGWVWGWTDLWRTIDGGRSWTHVDKSAVNDGLPPWIQMFSNKLVGWRINFDKVERTDDGGVIWPSVAGPGINLDSDYSPAAVAFQTDGLHGWLGAHYFVKVTPERRESLHLGPRSLDSGGTEAQVGAMFYTADGGRTWSRQPINTDIGYGILSIWIAPNGVPWAISGYSLFYLSGECWEKVDYAKCTQN